MKFNLLVTTVSAFFAITAMAAPVQDASALEGLLAREPSPQVDTRPFHTVIFRTWANHKRYRAQFCSASPAAEPVVLLQH
ncbi:hypothetical protein CC2G_012398 [Coprinopsis cinerea AmutBmut pab1-1]|nr:hypothetical protein CC2G_012398 [Coprinopsis cinerea AmutBmut pab1-1]